MLLRPVLFPRAYGFYIALAAMDVLLTTLILAKGGVELNKLAAWVFQAHGVPGASAYKFGTVMVVLIACEMAGRYRSGTMGRALAHAAVIISLIPVGIGAVELAFDVLAQNPLWDEQVARSIAEIGIGHREP
jgi:hypothetical protein